METTEMTITIQGVWLVPSVMAGIGSIKLGASWIQLNASVAEWMEAPDF